MPRVTHSAIIAAVITAGSRRAVILRAVHVTRSHSIVVEKQLLQQMTSNMPEDSTAMQLTAPSSPPSSPPGAGVPSSCKRCDEIIFSRPGTVDQHSNRNALHACMCTAMTAHRAIVAAIIATRGAARGSVVLTIIVHALQDK